MTDTFKNNTSNSRFEYHKEGAFAFANYRTTDNTLYIDYVEAPPELRGTGAASELMGHVFDHAQQHGLRIVPICGYAAAWMKRHSSDAA